MADVQGFTPLPELQRLSTKRTFAVFATESLDNYPENESVYAMFCFSKSFKLIQGRCRSKFRTRVKVNSEYKDYLTLPAALLAQQGPVGPARPTTLAITAGCTSLPLPLRSIVPR